MTCGSVGAYNGGPVLPVQQADAAARERVSKLLEPFRARAAHWQQGLLVSGMGSSEVKSLLRGGAREKISDRAQHIPDLIHTTIIQYDALMKRADDQIYSIISMALTVQWTECEFFAGKQYTNIDDVLTDSPLFQRHALMVKDWQQQQQLCERLVALQNLSDAAYTERHRFWSQQTSQGPRQRHIETFKEVYKVETLQGAKEDLKAQIQQVVIAWSTRVNGYKDGEGSASSQGWFYGLYNGVAKSAAAVGKSIGFV